MYKKTVSLVEVLSGGKVLDIGYGNGYLIQCLYKKCNLDIYGIDISEDMLEAAKKRNKKADAEGHLHLEIGDCCNLSFEDDTFAAITSINTIYFWSDTVKGLSEIRRTLVKDASFYNVVYTKEWLDKLSYTKKGFKKFEPEELVELGKQAGFENIEVKPVVKGRSFMVVYTK